MTPSIHDNLNAHKVAGVREAIEASAHGFSTFRPTVPTFNPIEQNFAKVKALLRTAAARNRPDLTIAIEDAFTAVGPMSAETTLPLLDNDAYEPT